MSNSPIVKEMEEQAAAYVHFSSQKEKWETPADLFAVLNNQFRFTLDVCASSDNAKVRRYFDKETNGLVQPWRNETCWMNPPYGRAIGEWMDKALLEGDYTTTVVCLVPARTDTRWWWRTARYGEIRFLPGRLKFGDADNSAPFPSAVVVFGAKARLGVYWWNWKAEINEQK